MLKKLLGIAPQIEADGSFMPSKLALKLATSPKSDYEQLVYSKYEGKKKKVLVIFTEQKNMKMQNGKLFSTGNHPIEALVPMLHLKSAGFEFEIATPSGQPVIFEMWAFPKKDEAVNSIFNELKKSFEQPKSLKDFVNNSLNSDQFAAVFIPGGHGVMLGIPEDENVGEVLRWAHNTDLFTITLCHGPGALMSTALNGKPFIYDGYKMAVFPDSVDKMTPSFGYLPGHMPSTLCDKLEDKGVTIINKKADNKVCLDRRLITGASPLASNNLGKLAVNTLLKELSA
ncbi:MAG: protein deglycase HchA [Flavobacteriaceae bacterium]|jgi:molecular chaperone Hsp31 and glyoxalase 3|nr:protein deglycase HchA [Flavobacteriaceae bacterium]|tara:strand:- start:75 stop:929 length:855 start_codon:yes stop_codon:yes gene_type:complete